MLIIQKVFLALTGFFICVFLIVHLGANALLLLPPDQARGLYNGYSAALRHNPFILVVAYINYACIIGHVILAVLITIRNRQSKGPQGQMKSQAPSVTWTSQNMGLLGTLLLAFIVIHMANFWYRVKFLNEDQDIYQLVMDLFKEPLYVFLYAAAMLPLGLHLAHGVKSAFKSLGLYHRKYLRWVAVGGVGYSWIVGLGFAVIPVVIYFRQVGL